MRGKGGKKGGSGEKGGERGRGTRGQETGKKGANNGPGKEGGKGGEGERRGKRYTGEEGGFGQGFLCIWPSRAIPHRAEYTQIAHRHSLVAYHRRLGYRREFPPQESVFRERKILIKHKLFFSNFSGTHIPPTIWFSWVSKNVPNFLAPTPSRGSPSAHPKISGPKSLGLGPFSSLCFVHFNRRRNRCSLAIFAHKDRRA